MSEIKVYTNGQFEIFDPNGNRFTLMGYHSQLLALVNSNGQQCEARFKVNNWDRIKKSEIVDQLPEDWIVNVLVNQ